MLRIKVEIVTINGYTVELEAFRAALISWGEAHFRPFPWRLSNTPYNLLIAEVMLHRTQVSQVVPIFDQFTKRFPNILALSQGQYQELYDHLRSLGLHWRIALIQDMAIQIQQKLDGEIPRTRDELLALPGVSDYIASAVRCFAWNLPDGIIDTNTVRIIGRLFDIPTRDSSRRTALFRNIICSLMDPIRPARYNYALLDLGALICTKARPPDCAICPIKKYCAYGMRNVGTATIAV